VIQQERVKPLSQEAGARGEYVLYWMQASVRAEYNHALEYAIREANDLGQPVVAYFGLTEEFPEANARHYHFLLEGLREVEAALRERGVKLVIRKEPPGAGVVDVAQQASLVVVDRGYLPIQRHWRSQASRSLRCPLIQVESDVVVPVEEASPKEEYSAATLRPKIHRKLDHYLLPLAQTDPRVDSLGLDLESLDVDDVSKVVSTLPVDLTVGKVPDLTGGAEEAKRLLQEFIPDKLDGYDDLRNDATQDYLSCMSPYLHFGQISPLYVALQVAGSGSPG
jgi:deoxyribodipyrimidine photo-lyase